MQLFETARNRTASTVRTARRSRNASSFVIQHYLIFYGFLTGSYPTFPVIIPLPLRTFIIPPARKRGDGGVEDDKKMSAVFFENWGRKSFVKID